MNLRKALSTTFNAAAAIVGAVGMAICVPLMALAMIGFPNGPSTARPAEAAEYALGAAGATALFVTGFRRKILKDNGPQQ